MKNRFLKLDEILRHYEALWKPSAFTNLDNSRLEDYPEIASWLNSLSDDEIDLLQISDTALLNSSSDYFEHAEELLSLISFPQSDASHEIDFPPFWDKDIPGRKVAQIKSFTSALLPATVPITEWCCGKFHLGRLVSELSSQQTLGLEINPDLVEQANSLTQKRKLESQAKAIECDVLSENIHDILESQHHIALHACGGLHTNMLERCVESESTRISLSPCCYHRFNKAPNYQALSSEGKISSLSLSNEDLRLATRQCNIASTAETLKRKQLQIWRLGFDRLQRDIRQIDEYLPCPSLSVKVLQGGFVEFCRTMAKRKGIVIPPGLDLLKYETIGLEDFKRYERIELARMLFRRALETWLVLDRALFLEEHGYRCKIVEFCESSVSPRNLLLDAIRQTKT